MAIVGDGLQAPALLVAGCVVAVALGLLLSPRLAVPAAVVVVVGTQMAVRSPRALSALLGALALFLGASAVRRLRDDARVARRALRQAEVLQEQYAREAALAERARMARDLHDVVAHALAALSVQLEAAHALLARPGSATQARELIDGARTLVREGLDDARAAIEALDGAHQMPGALNELARRFSQTTGVPCSVQLEGCLRPLPPGGDVALYRAAQEALTNALKHAEPTAVWITLRQGPDSVELRVDNEAAERDARPYRELGGRRGLRGLRERAESLSGSLVVTPRDTGFVLRMTIPND